MQQRSGPVDGSPAAGGIRVSDPTDRFERAAEATAHAVTAQRARGPASAPGSAPAGGRRALAPPFRGSSPPASAAAASAPVAQRAVLDNGATLSTLEADLHGRPAPAMQAVGAYTKIAHGFGKTLRPSRTTRKESLEQAHAGAHQANMANQLNRVDTASQTASTLRRELANAAFGAAGSQQRTAMTQRATLLLGHIDSMLALVEGDLGALPATTAARTAVAHDLAVVGKAGTDQTLGAQASWLRAMVDLSPGGDGLRQILANYGANLAGHDVFRNENVRAGTAMVLDAMPDVVGRLQSVAKTVAAGISAAPVVGFRTGNPGAQVVDGAYRLAEALVPVLFPANLSFFKGTTRTLLTSVLENAEQKFGANDARANSAPIRFLYLRGLTAVPTNAIPGSGGPTVVGKSLSMATLLLNELANDLAVPRNAAFRSNRFGPLRAHYSAFQANLLELLRD